MDDVLDEDKMDEDEEPPGLGSAHQAPAKANVPSPRTRASTPSPEALSVSLTLAASH